MNAETVPFPEVRPDQARAFSHKHGLVGEWHRIASRGIVHSVYRVGDAVVKIPRDHPEWVCDTLTEAVAVPAVVAAGVPTPKLIAFDASREDFPVPVLILELAHGSPVDPSDPVRPDVDLLGQRLAQVHTLVRHVPDPNGWLDGPGDEHFEDRFEQAVSLLLLTPSERAFLDSVRPHIAAPSQACSEVFLHNDVHENNLLWTAHGSLTLIDWGDAAWGDPASEFTRIPTEWLEETVASYERLVSTDVAFRRRVVRCQLDNILSNIVRGSRWAAESQVRLHRLSEVCGDFLGAPVSRITA
ncbi:MAG: aminoglycoside phosphotransferase family protein [Armatimonadetes bacterium]|nr:aminoglycoside phosphotransferase family protein [Armatimonadota bacterium]